ncbi:unnamed protein product, partial [Polarella glacialis]
VSAALASAIAVVSGQGGFAPPTDLDDWFVGGALNHSGARWETLQPVPQNLSSPYCDAIGCQVPQVVGSTVFSVHPLFWGSSASALTSV